MAQAVSLYQKRTFAIKMEVENGSGEHEKRTILTRCLT